MNLQAVYQRRKNEAGTIWKGAAPSKFKNKDLDPASNEFVLKRQRKPEIEVKIERKGPRQDKHIVQTISERFRLVEKIEHQQATQRPLSPLSSIMLQPMGDNCGGWEQRPLNIG